MKKILVFFMATALCLAAFAQTEDSEEEYEQEREASSGIPMSVGGGALFRMTMAMPKEGESSTAPGFGVNAFFDAKYAEVNVNFVFDISSSGSGDEKVSATLMGLGFGVLGKYPIPMGEKLTLFPLVGIDYNLVLSSSVKIGDADAVKSDSPGDSNQLSILAGIGVDYALSEKLYIRGEAMFMYRLPPKDVEDMMYLGPWIKAAVGYKL
jgi:opacity protein-like surface antigen